MPKTVTINGTNYSLPQQNDTAGWGQPLSDIITALISVANTAPGDILNTTFSIGNNVTASTNITGLSFDPAKVTTARVDYAIKRSTTSTTLVERGTILVTYNSGTSSWDFELSGTGDAGVLFTITAGQFAYTSSNLAGTSYTGTMAFNAYAFS